MCSSLQIDLYWEYRIKRNWERDETEKLSTKIEKQTIWVLIEVQRKREIIL